jgi:catechol 2,3-dioxygenase-like lactoylglutathione lyase family enzyme
LILNHLDLYVPDVAATRDFFVRHFGFRHQDTRGADRLAVLHDDAGLELVISKPISQLGGAEQVALGLTTYHIGFRLPSVQKVDEVFGCLQAGSEREMDPPKKIRGRYLFYCLAPGNILVEVASAGCDGTDAVQQPEIS